MDSDLREVIQTGAILLSLVIGFWAILAHRSNALAGALISAISNHWMAIERLRIELRNGTTQVFYAGLNRLLEQQLEAVAQGDVAALAELYLPHDEFDRQSLLALPNTKEEVFKAIAREYALRDIIFNFFEEEFLIGKHLRLVRRKLWRYWRFYIVRAINGSISAQNHWKLRQVLGRTSVEFRTFVEQEVRAEAPPSTPKPIQEALDDWYKNRPPRIFP